MLKIIIKFTILSITFAQLPNLYINEFLASNSETNLEPDFNSFVDWIEIYNSEDSIVNIGGYYLTDDLSNPTKFQLPEDLLIGSNNHFILWADDLDTSIISCHTNFKLNKNGEQIGLFNPNGLLIDSITYNKQLTDISFGRKPDGFSEWFFFDAPTPLSENTSIGFSDTIRTNSVQFSIPAGFYNSPQSIFLNSENLYQTIRFTLNGEKPREYSQQYSTPIIIDTTTVIRARVFDDSLLPSRTVTNSYLINANSSLPIISLCTDPMYLWDEYIGIYSDGANYNGGYDTTSNYWQDWERPINIELFESEQSETVIINKNAGIKIQGGFTRSFPQKSLGIYFKSKFGYTSLGYQIFPDKQINLKRLILRNGGNDWNQSILLDGLFSNIAKQIKNIDYQSYKPSVIYINGQFWGIHNIREKIDEYYVKSNYGIDSDDIDLLENNMKVIVGDADDYQQIIDYINLNDLSEAIHYNYVASKIDIDAYINYQILEIYFANRDWPQNNQKYWRNNNSDSKWRWILYDLEGLMIHQNISQDNLQHATNLYYGETDIRWATFLFRELLKNSFFKNTFIQRYSYYLNTIFSTTKTSNILDSLKINIESEIIHHTDRWNDECWDRGDGVLYCGIESYDQWEVSIDFINSFLNNRSNYILTHIVNYFNIEGNINTLTIEANSNGGDIYIAGSIIEELPFNGLFFDGIPITLNAIPKLGYQFLGWDLGDSSIINSDSISFVLSQDTTVNAIFEQTLQIKDNKPVSTKLKIYPNHPNPFNPITTLKYDNPEDGIVNINIYDLRGRIIKTLLNSLKTAGIQSINWNAKNNQGETVPAGVYLYSIEAGEFRQTKKMILLK